MVRLTIYSALLLLVFVCASEALKCYGCRYQSSSNADDEGDISCKDGPLASTLSRDCGTLRYVQIAENVFVPIDSYLGKNVKNGTVISPEQQRQLVSSYSCIKLEFDGELISTPPVRSYLTTRDCIGFNGTVDDKCYSNKNSEILADIDDPLLKDYVANGVRFFTNDTDVAACTCSNDNCNGAMNTVTASASLLIMSTIVLQFLSQFKYCIF
ncbi:unnamed protein product [Orchesella dallaii]|uniref:Protein sleepless n=1 Tax=Orchesella dallaii TaxID=48710 RepID=A0ABP1RHS5_9HEXA